jgi:hypothetical protein
MAPQGSLPAKQTGRFLEAIEALLYWNFRLANTRGLVFRKCSIDVKLEGGDIEDERCSSVVIAKWA